MGCRRRPRRLRPSPRGGRRRGTGRSYGPPTLAWWQRPCFRVGRRPGSGPARMSTSAGRRALGPPLRARALPHRRGRQRSGSSRFVRQCRCIGAARRRCGCPSSGRRSRRRRGLPARHGAAPRRSHVRHREPRRRPRMPGSAGAACRAASLPRPTRRSSSSSCVAGPKAARAPAVPPGAGPPPARTVRLCAPSGPRTPPASGQGLRCDLRPLPDRLSSHTDDQRWPQP